MARALQTHSDIHTMKGKQVFIRDLCNSTRDTILARVKAMPQEWDGLELREYIAEVFDRQRFKEMGPVRRKDYRNTLAVTQEL